MLKIESGHLKNLKIEVFPGAPIRPTSGRIRAALFDRLGSQLLGADFWDICAGSGAVGAEAISRGAAFVAWVESDKLAIKGLENLYPRIMSRLESAKIQPLPIMRIYSLALEASLAEKIKVRSSSKIGQRILFFDPPYEHFESLVQVFLEIISSLREAQLSKNEGSNLTLIFQFDKRSTDFLKARLAELQWKGSVEKWVTYGPTGMLHFEL